MPTAQERLRTIFRYATTGWRRTLIVAALTVLTIALIAQILYTNRDLLLNHEWELTPRHLGYAVFYFCLDLLVALICWHTLVIKFTGFNNFRKSSKIVLYGNLAQRIPGTVWYIASRAVLYEEQHDVPKRTISMIGGLELILFVSSGLVVTLFALPFWSIPIEFFEQLNGSVVMIAIALASVLLIHPRLLAAIWRRVSKQAAVILSWRDTFYWLLLYALTWIVGGFVLFSVARVFGPIPLNMLLTYIGIWTLSALVSLIGAISISVIGLREIALVTLLTPLLTLPVALAVAIIIRIIWLSGELIFALISIKL